MNKIIAFDPGINSGVAIFVYDNNNFEVKTETVKIKDIRPFMRANKDSNTVIIEQANGSLGSISNWYAGYITAMIDIYCPKAYIHEQFYGTGAPYINIARKYTKNQHEIDALAHIVGYVKKYKICNYNW